MSFTNRGDVALLHVGAWSDLIGLSGLYFPGLGYFKLSPFIRTEPDWQTDLGKDEEGEFFQLLTR